MLIAVELFEALGVAVAPSVVVVQAESIEVGMPVLAARVESRVESIEVGMPVLAALVESRVESIEVGMRWCLRRGFGSRVELIEVEMREPVAAAELRERERRAVVESTEMIAQETPAISLRG